MTITGRSGQSDLSRPSRASPSGPGMRMSVTSTVGRAVRQRLERRVGAVEAPAGEARLLHGALQHPADAGIIVDDPDLDGVEGRVHAWSSVIGNSILNTVRPGRLEYSISPSWRLTSSCATARPRPLPPGRPVTSG
jgi:hypothetical protein